MKAVSKFLVGGIGLAALAGAAPAAAQYYPSYGYGQGGGLGAIIDAILGAQRYGQPGYGYGVDPNRERFLVEQCARATEARLQTTYGNAGYGVPSYGGPAYGGQAYGGYGYNNYNQARILNISRVERRSGGGLKIYGVATSGRVQANPYGYGGYGGGYGAPYGAPYGGYGAPSPYGYGAPMGHGYNAGAVADLRFDCDVDYRGRIRDIDVERNRY